jgi:iodotyrosine deiodinase
MSSEPDYVPLPPRFDPGEEPESAAQRFADSMASRRSVRDFSPRPVSRHTIEALVRCAASAPSGANKQPWRFVAVGDPELKRQIRAAAEEEEERFYTRRASERWLADLRPLGTDPQKPFLEIAPWLIVVFRLTRGDDGGQVYYSEESVGIATGFLLSAIHRAGLVALTHTPSPMRFLERLLGRGEHERAYMLIPVGYPAEDARVPVHALPRRPLAETLLFESPAGSSTGH